MAKPIGTFGILAFKESDEILDALQRIWMWAQDQDAVIIYHPFVKKWLRGKQAAIARTEQEFVEKSDALISVGGDGTFLSAIHMTGFSDKPVAGVHLGSLGFLTDLGVGELEEQLSLIKRGKYKTIRRMQIEATIQRQGKKIRSMVALNDIFVNRIAQPRLISVAAWYGNEYITDLRADGVIVATPSGSTAYSLSAGGPIVEPTVSALLLSPICPHSLSERPIVLPANKPIRLVINHKNPPVQLSADGRESYRLQPGDEIVVRSSGYKRNIITLSNRTHFDLLRAKLEWGKDFRNRETHGQTPRTAH